MKRAQTEYRVGTGASSLLMLLVILSLTTLGILSFTSADADLRLTERNARMVEAYHEAQSAFEEALSLVDEYLCLVPADSDFRATLPDGSIGRADYVWQEDGTLLLSVDAGFDRSLQGTLCLFPKDAERWKLVRYALVNAGTWQPEEDLMLFTGREHE